MAPTCGVVSASTSVQPRPIQSIKLYWTNKEMSMACVCPAITRVSTVADRLIPSAADATRMPSCVLLRRPVGLFSRFLAGNSPCGIFLLLSWLASSASIDLCINKPVHFVTGFGGAGDQFCHPKVLVEQLTHYEHWTLGTEIALAFNIALVVALCGYLLCSGKYGCNSSCRMSCCGGRNSRQPNYQNLISAVPSSQRSKGAALNAQYSDRAPEAGPCIQADMSSDEEI